MSIDPVLPTMLSRAGVDRREFLKYCGGLASALALAPAMAPRIAEALERARRPSVIWLSFQECTGCTESLTRADAPSLEQLIFSAVSLDYHHTLQAASGHAAEAARLKAMKDNAGKYLVLVDGAVPLGDPGFSTIAGRSNRDILEETVAGAAAVIAMGSCAAFGGLPAAAPNPTGAVAISALVKDKPVVNVPGCPPIPVVMTGVVAHFLTFGKLPELDALGRPKVFYGETVHDRCYRRPFYDRGLFAESFDDEGARKGWCLFKLGCKGPVTYNACATVKWNGGVSFPIQSGHPCLGCSQPEFWDAGAFYKPLSMPWGADPKLAATAAAAGVGIGVAAGQAAINAKKRAAAERKPVTLDDLEAKP
ncbi:MAG: hydrogenase small subunit [Actinomycetota bacterium]